MKKYYPGPSSGKDFGEAGSAWAVAFFIRAALIILAIIGCISFAGQAQGLVFKNPVRIAGSAGENGTVYRFSQVTGNTDALVTISDRSDWRVELVSIDLASAGHDKAFQPQVTYNNNTTPWGISDWWLEFDIKFVVANTNIPISVSGFDITALDIDGNGDRLNEWVGFYNLKTSILESNSLLQVFNLLDLLLSPLFPVGKKFAGPVSNFSNIDTSATSVMATAHYEEKSQFSLRVGGHSTGSTGAADRMYSFWFKSFTFNEPVESTLPVTLTAFTAKHADAGTMLSWSTSMEKNVSHFVIERSLNGSDYSDIGIIFTEGDSYGNRDYRFTDALKNVKAQVVYYRLKMVDLDGRYEHSPVRTIRMDQQDAPTIVAWPNPVTDQLRVTLPADWQDKKVVIELLNTNGQVVKRIEKPRAGHTETLQTRDLGTGMYLVRVSNDAESATQRIVKSK